MKFSCNKEISYEEAVTTMFEKLGNAQIMALASSLNDYVMVRNVSCLFYDEKIYFKTDKNFRKTKQLLENPNVALCWSGIQVEGVAQNKGLVVDEPGRKFEEGYKKYLWESYNKYSHTDTEILIEVTPKYVEVWDTSEDGYAYQLFIDFENKSHMIKSKMDYLQKNIKKKK